MVRLDLTGMNSREVNQKLKELIKTEAEIELDNPHSIHNVATALIGEGQITLHGSTGFYTGGFLEGPTLIVKGNTGWYTGDNMTSGEIIVNMNSGSNAAPSRQPCRLGHERRHLDRLRRCRAMGRKNDPGWTHRGSGQCRRRYW